MRDSFNFAAAKNEKANYFKKITKTITLNKKCYLQFSRFPPLDDNINIRFQKLKDIAPKSNFLFA